MQRCHVGLQRIKTSENQTFNRRTPWTVSLIHLNSWCRFKICLNTWGTVTGQAVLGHHRPYQLPCGQHKRSGKPTHLRSRLQRGSGGKPWEGNEPAKNERTGQGSPGTASSPQLQTRRIWAEEGSEHPPVPRSKVGISQRGRFEADRHLRNLLPWISE